VLSSVCVLAASCVHALSTNLFQWLGFPFNTALCVQVGFIGLGNMGSRMAANLKHGGHQLVVHDRSIAAMEEACKDGAEAASSPVDMASQEGVVA